ncbi:RNA polymerase sigma factor [Sandaracinus amylolyticus]|uniref:Sigma-70 family RNA polymerase sigma factor n=1 Tax=Sandaracinus amylolyticus TaxID=927083 RepID=A0A0F6SE47_9BACT|nr:hypothetical protein [Sandaracinus amylolyticus]AKF04564.1 hypothetical protein DB32_001713 [Sandaracinus amylolyticus]
MDDDRTLVEAALARDPAACRALITRLTPILRARVARVLGKHAARRGRPAERQEVLDLIQEIFVVLLDRDGRVLRSWDPERGLSLANFVGLVAEREASAFLKSGRRSAWAEAPTEDLALHGETEADAGPEPSLAARQLLERLAERLRERLSARDFALFHALYVQEREIDDVAETFSMTSNALYTFRSRLRRDLGEIQRELSSPPVRAGGLA